MTLRRSERAGYVEVVTDFFSELRGGGLVLSAVDLELVRGWEAEGIPVEVVCRGLRGAWEAHLERRPGVPPPRHLTYYARAVSDAARAAREKSLGSR